VRCYYSEVEVTDGQKIPAEGPVLLCANHPNSLLDPIVVGIAARRPVRFFAKAPLFKKPMLGPVMHALGMIPAYRAVDDSRQVRQNLQSLDRGTAALQQRSAVGIFPEGKSHDEVGVEMVRGGAARMALQACSQGAEDLQVVPIGLNYEHKERFRSDVWVRVGDPIVMRDWLAENRSPDDHERQTFRKFTQDLQRHLQKVTIHLEDQQWQEWLSDLEHLAPSFPLGQPTKVPQLRRRKLIADAMNYFLQQDAQRALDVAEQIRRYRDEARTLGLTPRSSLLHSAGWLAWVEWFVKLLGWTIGAIPAGVGLLFHLLPFWISRHVARLFTPPGRTAVSLYRLLVGIPTFVVWYILALAILLIFLKPTWGILIWITLPWVGIFAFHYCESARQAWYDLGQQFLNLVKPTRIEALKRDRQSLQEQLGALAEDYRQHLVNASAAGTD
jgi:1-acyl-sn-glycerol-3-phosphate acyltransferase